MPEVDALPQRAARLVGLAVADPVDQVAVTIVEDARLRLYGAAGVAQSALDGAQFLWLQVAVRLMSPDGVVELRDDGILSEVLKLANACQWLSSLRLMSMPG